jgi:hypothetical protein
MVLCNDPADTAHMEWIGVVRVREQLAGARSARPVRPSPTRGAAFTGALWTGCRALPQAQSEEHNNDQPRFAAGAGAQRA